MDMASMRKMTCTKHSYILVQNIPHSHYRIFLSQTRYTVAADFTPIYASA